MSIEIKERQLGKVTLLELSGRLALGEGSTGLHERINAHFEAGRVNLLLECSQVTALDSQGISALVRGVISAGKRGGQFKILKPSPRVRQILEVTRLFKVIETFDDEAKALASF